MTNPDDEKTAADAAEESDAMDEVVDGAEATSDVPRRSRLDWMRVTVYALLPALALILATTAGFLKYVDYSAREGATARAESMQAASAGTIALLSYTPDKVEQQLNDACSLLTGSFLESYRSLINQVVIPGAKQQRISAVATVARVGSVSADPSEAVALVFFDQAVTVGADAPTSTASSVRVTLEKTGGKWLISEFRPV